MSNPLRKLAGQTAIYGASSIIGRMLNFLLVPIYTRAFMQGEFGVVTELYAYVGFLIIVYTYGMETAYFRFMQNDADKQSVYPTAFGSVFTSSVLITVLLLLGSDSIGMAIGYGGNTEYIRWFALILGLDAIAALPFAKLRQEQKAIRFAVIRLTGIALNIGLNMLLVFYPYWLQLQGMPMPDWMSSWYDPDMGVGYVFLSNLAASFVTLLMLIPTMTIPVVKLDTKLLKRMFAYGWPMLLIGFAGNINEMIDRVLLRHLLPYDDATNLAQIGVYGANYKLSIFMTLFIQAFRYAAEPFFFDQSKKSGAKQVYSQTMNFFVIAGAVIFLLITLYLDVFKYFIGEEFREGIGIVPVLLLANLFLGVYYNLSIWYKLSDKTRLGAAVAVAGAVITLVLNIWLIPIIGYVGSAYATLACYVFMCVISWALGHKYYPVNYPIGRYALYLGIALIIFYLHTAFINPMDNLWIKYSLAFAWIIIYAGATFSTERRLSKSSA